MTGKGERERPWTTDEERYLVLHAGVDSLGSICRALRRSRSAVRTKASRLHVSLAHYERMTVICPKCGEARSKSGAWQSGTGFCDVCRKRAAYDAAQRRQAEAYAELDPMWRAVYDATEAKTGASAIPPRPPAPDTSGMTALQAARARDLHAIDVERWEIARLTRLTDAVKKRTQRMREKSGTNPRRFRGDGKRVQHREEGDPWS